MLRCVGTCDISVVTTVTLTDEEVKTLSIDKNEYEAREWVDVATILKADAATASVTVPCWELLGLKPAAAAAASTAASSSSSAASVSSAPTIPSVLHPALIRGLCDYVKLLFHKRLESAANDSTTSDAALAALTRQYLQLCRTISNSPADLGKQQVDNFL